MDTIASAKGGAAGVAYSGQPEDGGFVGGARGESLTDGGFAGGAGGGRLENGASAKKARRERLAKYWDSLKFALYCATHPLDGFWDLTHEKRGTMAAANTILFLTLLVRVLKLRYTSFVILTVYWEGLNIFLYIASVLFPLILWVVGNWCLTTLFDGEGNFKDIFVATAYALVPIPLALIPTTLFSNIALKQELDIISFINTVALIWTFLLIFVGMMVTHDYTIGKNFITTIGTIVAMAFIMFVAILFTTLVGKIVSFITNIFVEINYRL